MQTEPTIIRLVVSHAPLCHYLVKHDELVGRTKARSMGKIPSIYCTGIINDSVEAHK